MYAADRNAESPAFDDCPAHCDTYNDARSDYCSNCPIGILRDQFREDTEQELSELPGGRYGFDYLNECVINALSVEHLPREQQTATTARLLGIIDGERGRMRRVKDWNEKQKAENAGK